MILQMKEQGLKEEINLSNNKAFLKLLEIQTSQPVRSDAAFKQMYQLIITKKSKSEQIPQLTQIISKMFNKVSKEEGRQFACKRRIGSTLTSTQKLGNSIVTKAYICHDCKEEEQAVICENCFEKLKHKGHCYQQIVVIGRFCDCGDHNYWKKDGFCSKHSSKKKSKLDMTHFVNISRKFMDFIVQLYNGFKFAVNNGKQLKRQKQLYKYLKKYLPTNIDVLISSFLNKFVELNREQTFNNVTIQLLQTQYDLPYETVKECCPMKQIFFRFISFENAIVQGIELFNLLFIRNQQLKKYFTIRYIKQVSEKSKFYLNNYNKFSQSLLTSSKIITDLVQNSQIQILTFTLFKNPYEQPKQHQLERHLDILGKAYQIYSQNCLLLTKLKPQAFKVYWRYFSQQDGFVRLANDFTIFQKEPASIQILNQKWYYLEEYPILLCLAVLKKVSHSNKCLICFNLRQTGKNVFNNNSLEEMKIENNFFLTKLRIWTIFLFAYFFKCKRILSANQLADNHKFIKDLLDHIDIDQKTFSSFLLRIWQILLQKLWSLCVRVCSKKQFTSVQNSYFKSALSNNNLLRLDFFLIKFIVIYFQKYNKNKQIYDEITKILEGIFNKSLQQIHQQNQNTNQTANKDLQKKIQTLTFFVGLMNQAIVSDINQLVLFSLIRGQVQPKNKMMGNYQILLKRVLNSIQSHQHQINSNTFRDVFHKLFFEDEQLELKCINKPNDFFMKQKYHNLSYLYSLFFKIKQQENFNSFENTQYMNSHQIGTSTYGHQLMVDAYYLDIFPLIRKQTRFESKHLQTQARMLKCFYGIYYIKQQNIKKLFPSNTNQNQSYQQWQKDRKGFQHEESSSKNCIQGTDHLEIKKEKFCVLNDQCENTENQNLLMLSYVFYSNSQGIFSIDKRQRILCFDACGHYCHQNCLKKLFKDNQVNECLLCHSKWNFTFPCSSKNTTHKQFERLKQIISQNTSFQAQLFKSLVFYLVRFFSIDEIDFLYKSIQVYRYIYKQLKFMKNQNKYLTYNMAEITSIQQRQMIKMIVSVLHKEEYIQNKIIKMCHIDAIKMMVEFLSNEDQCKLKIENKNYFLRDKFLQDKWLQLLPKTLSQLFQDDYECRYCSKKDAYSYLLCLLPHREKKDQKWCICQNCAEQNNILNHIKQHHFKEDLTGKYDKQGKAGIWIETHSGRIVYDHIEVKQGDQPNFCQYRAGCLYAKDKHIAYRLQKGYNKTDFARSDKFISTELNRIYSCSFQSKAKLIPKQKSQ